MAGGESTNPSRPDRGHKTAAMLIDFENVAIPLEKTVAGMLNTVQSFLKWLETGKKCEVGEKHAFADWRTYPISMGKLSKSGIICHQVDSLPRKNSADIALAVEGQRLLSMTSDMLCSIISS